MQQFIRATTVSLLGLSLCLPALASAQQANTGSSVVPATASAKPRLDGDARTRPNIASTTFLGVAAVKAKERANKEIERRVDALNELDSRIQSMQRVSASFKQALSGNTQNQIQSLLVLKDKIDNETSTTTLKEDVKSITDAYRTFMLVLPQGRISAMADRITTVAVMMQGVGAKLQARIQTAAAQGVNTSSATALLTDLAAKIIEAQTQAQAAVNLILPLKPDNGDKTVMAANATALKQAQADLKLAQKALDAGRKDIDAIMKFIKNAKPQTSTATSTTQ